MQPNFQIGMLSSSTDTCFLALGIDRDCAVQLRKGQVIVYPRTHRYDRPTTHHPTKSPPPTPLTRFSMMPNTPDLDSIKCSLSLVLSPYPGILSPFSRPCRSSVLSLSRTHNIISFSGESHATVLLNSSSGGGHLLAGSISPTR
jgi:hypothetical protein